jgi:hypothetical protein
MWLGDKQMTNTKFLNPHERMTKRPRQASLLRQRWLLLLLLRGVRRWRRLLMCLKKGGSGKHVLMVVNVNYKSST